MFLVCWHYSGGCGWYAPLMLACIAIKCNEVCDLSACSYCMTLFHVLLFSKKRRRHDCHELDGLRESITIVTLLIYSHWRLICCHLPVFHPCICAFEINHLNREDLLDFLANNKSRLRHFRKPEVWRQDVKHFREASVSNTAEIRQVVM